jgi:hypothetical protein
MILYTVEDLATAVRQMLDEQNRDAISTELDILPTLNRAADFAFDILARKYPEPILQYATLDFQSGVSEYDIPEDVFEDRILKLETEIPLGTAGRSNYIELNRISYRDISSYESVSTSSFPLYYCIIGRKIRVLPQPSGVYNARMWSIRNPEKLVMPQGRVTLLNTAQNYLIVDAAGSDLTTESDQLNCYVNIVDGQTGDIKGTLQVQSIAGTKITFRSTPTRTTVLNRTVTGVLSDILVNQDDYICVSSGTCVPYYGKPTSNFLIQYTIAELVRKLGGQADTEENILKKFEQQVERTWVGRQIDTRIKKKSNNWGVNTRRYFWYWSK